jgi:hypothetical protein
VIGLHDRDDDGVDRFLRVDAICRSAAGNSISRGKPRWRRRIVALRRIWAAALTAARELAASQTR